MVGLHLHSSERDKRVFLVETVSNATRVQTLRMAPNKLPFLHCLPCKSPWIIHFVPVRRSVNCSTACAFAAGMVFNAVAAFLGREDLAQTWVLRSTLVIGRMWDAHP